MIERLRFSNFQRHEYQDIDLSSPVTVIVGKTGSGKSAALRCFRWIAQNRPSGDSFIRHGTDTVKGSLVVDGKEVLRKRSPTFNGYRHSGKRFEAMGHQGVPDEVVALLNVSDINFAGQHDAAFWLSLSPGEAGRELNKIVNLDLIDRTLANVAAELKKARTEVEISKERLKKAEDDESRLQWTGVADEELQRIEELQAESAGLSGKRNRLKSLLVSIASAESEAAVPVPISEFAKIELLKGQLDKLGERRCRLMGLLTKLKQAESEAREASETVKRLCAELERRTGGNCPLCKQPVPT